LYADDEIIIQKTLWMRKVIEEGFRIEIMCLQSPPARTSITAPHLRLPACLPACLGFEAAPLPPHQSLI